MDNLAQLRMRDAARLPVNDKYGFDVRVSQTFVQHTLPHHTGGARYNNA
jgi:hypothetical protein